MSEREFSREVCEGSEGCEAQRWIVIGEVKSGVFVTLGNAGYPGGLCIFWRGRRDWCQPFEFLDWPELLWAVERRLNLAGLRGVATACGVRKNRPLGPELRVLVRRFPNLLKARRAQRNRRTKDRVSAQMREFFGEPMEVMWIA